MKKGAGAPSNVQPVCRDPYQVGDADRGPHEPTSRKAGAGGSNPTQGQGSLGGVWGGGGTAAEKICTWGGPSQQVREGLTVPAPVLLLCKLPATCIN
jgi:hypothetical protein